MFRIFACKSFIAEQQVGCSIVPGIQAVAFVYLAVDVLGYYVENLVPVYAAVEFCEPFVKAWRGFVMHMSLIAEYSRLHVSQVVFAGLYVVGIVALLLEFFSLEEVAGVVLV